MENICSFGKLCLTLQRFLDKFICRIVEIETERKAANGSQRGEQSQTIK
jgi:hypothetical protein